MRYLILISTSKIGYAQIFNIYEDLGRESISNIISQQEMPRIFIQPGYMQKLLANDIEFIIQGFVVPSTRLFIELITFSIISIVLIQKIGITFSILVFFASFLSFFYTIKKQSKKNKRLGNIREKSQANKSKVISMIEKSLKDIYSYRPREYIVNKFSRANLETKTNSQDLVAQILIGRANFETIFSHILHSYVKANSFLGNIGAIHQKQWDTIKKENGETKSSL